MEYKELKNKKISELHNLLAVTRDKVRELKFKDANKQLKNVREIRMEKKTISKILTILNLDEDVKVVEKPEGKEKKDSK